MPDNPPTEKYVVLYSETYVKELEKRAGDLSVAVIDAEEYTKEERIKMYIDFHKWMDR